jgi:molybdenum cofactor cytidylyltransferase
MPFRTPSDPAEAVAAIVLAAGFSSRMRAFKPMLPFGGQTVLSHVVASLREAGLRHIHVVTGHNADLIAPELANLGVTAVHNGNFAAGMFTSVQAGVASLPAAMDGFLLLPVDVPLVRAWTIRQVLHTAATADARIVYPTFCGKRGHPPFVGRALFREILSCDGEGGLRAILARREAEAASVAVFDRGCLLDMDSPRDYGRLQETLAHLHVPDEDECVAMLEAAATPEPVRRHCRMVAGLATSLALSLNKADGQLDACLVRAAALVHDIAKGQPQHAQAGAALLREFGFPGVADLVARHMTITFDGDSIDEGAVLYLADKLIQGEMRVRLEERFAPALTRFDDDAVALASVRRRYADAQAILSAVEARIGTLDPWRGTPVPHTETGAST